MRFTIAYHGVPVGWIDLEPRRQLVAGAVVPLPGYAAVQPLVSAASETLRQLGFFGNPGPSGLAKSRSAAFLQAAELGRVLELRDLNGNLTATDFIELVETPYPEVPLAAFVGFRSAAAGMTAPKHLGPPAI